MSEAERIYARDHQRVAWDRWGSYLSERQWGTVREDYSANGDAWTYFSHDDARFRAYRRGEDGLLGICDSDCRFCISPAFWNGKDPILKERPFGLSNPQGNHGEDLKDYFYHLENTPTHSFMRGLYKYPQAEFPYQHLIEENGRRSRLEPEYELVDTGIFNDSAYFDIFIEYAKAGVDDICIQIRAINRGNAPAPLTILPTLWFRNTWAWGQKGIPKPQMHMEEPGVIRVKPWGLPEYLCYAEGTPDILFTENDTNTQHLFNVPNRTPYVKDAFHRHVIQGEQGAVNPHQEGTKAAPVYQQTVAPGDTFTVRLRLSTRPLETPFDESFSQTFALREQEALDYFESLNPGLTEDDSMIQRRALAGLLWCKKFYYFPVLEWLQGDPTQPTPPAERWEHPNAFWKELHAHDVISMPDCWEYPYFCAWDLMFHSVAFTIIDAHQAKKQSMVLRGERYTSTNAQMPAYEWALSDVNPPIGGWAAWRVYSIERGITGEGDREYLKRAFNKLLIEYSWWSNRVDKSGDNVFEGGFLGLDNIGIFDRRYPLADGSIIEQSDGTAWMAAYCLNMLNISLELAKEDPAYEDIADKFFNDFIYLAAAVNAKSCEGVELWDNEDGFYYDVLKRPNGSVEYLKTRSMVGLTPIFAVESLDIETAKRFPILQRRLEYFQTHRPYLLDQLHHIGVEVNGRRLVSLVPPERLRRICEKLFDETEFLSPHGIRALSRVYKDHPYTLTEGGQTQTLSYSPADSPVAMFGGNSNWRGPVWMPMNYLLIEALQKFGFYFGDTFKVEFPTGSGVEMNLWDISLELEKRLVSIFQRDENGKRPFNGEVELFQTDPHWKDLILFNEYFNGDNGSGVGASHQTGWTSLVAKMIRQLHTAERV